MWMSAKANHVKMMQLAKMESICFPVNVPLDGLEPFVNQVNAKRIQVQQYVHEQEIVSHYELRIGILP